MNLPQDLYTVLTVLAIVGAGFLILNWYIHQVYGFDMKPPGQKDDGPFVAEVWLEWEICRGSTLYRQRFSSERAAARAVRRAAEVLDNTLPRFYYDSDWSGRRIRYPHEFEIRFGVRRANEHDTTATIWSPELPGHREFTGEHSSAHPLTLAAKDLQGTSLEGVKL